MQKPTNAMSLMVFLPDMDPDSHCKTILRFCRHTLYFYLFGPSVAFDGLCQPCQASGVGIRRPRLPGLVFESARHGRRGGADVIRVMAVTTA